MKGASAILLALTLSAPSALAQSANEAASSRDVEATVTNVNSSNTTLSGQQQMVGSNIGLTTYPSLQCERPQLEVQKPKEVQRTTGAAPNIAETQGILAIDGAASQGGDYNTQVKKYNAAAKTYNAQMAAYNSCAQTYTANANADLHRIRDKLEAAVGASVAMMPSGAQVAAGSNIGLTDYPAAICAKPSNLDESLKPGSVPPLDAKTPEIDAYNARATRYENALSKYNSQTVDYNSCIQTYFGNANADMRRIQSVLDAVVASAKSANIKIVAATETKNMDTPAKNFADSYAAPGLQINKIP